MKIEDFRTGMSAKLRNGDLVFAICGLSSSGLSSSDSFFSTCDERGVILFFSNYAEDLTRTTSEYDIMTVFEASTDFRFILKSKGSLLWEREEEPTEMTVADIENQLGINNLKIIKG